MKTFTAKEKAKIYRTVAQIIFRRDPKSRFVYVCNYLERRTEYQVRDIFEEFYLFEPEEYKDNHWWIQWWPDDDKDSRIFALLMAAEMAEKPIKY